MIYRGEALGICLEPSCSGEGRASEGLRRLRWLFVGQVVHSQLWVARERADVLRRIEADAVAAQLDTHRQAVTIIGDRNIR